MVVDIELALGNRAISDDEVGSLDNPTANRQKRSRSTFLI